MKLEVQLILDFDKLIAKSRQWEFFTHNFFARINNWIQLMMLGNVFNICFLGDLKDDRAFVKIRKIAPRQILWKSIIISCTKQNFTICLNKGTGKYFILLMVKKFAMFEKDSFDTIYTNKNLS